MRHPIPRSTALTFSKRSILDQLQTIDNDKEARTRILSIENMFRARIKQHLNSLPLLNSNFREFKTSPFVVMFYAAQQNYQNVSQIEDAILPAKVFSSMETSAGKMVEEIMLPHYGWETVPSSMHTANSCLDGKQLLPDKLRVATLKSGPRCLNDEMSENFADAIKNNLEEWAHNDNVSNIDFTYGVLYGTKKQSNKKDWHILRKLCEKLNPEEVLTPPNNSWGCSIIVNSIKVDINIRIGFDWWKFLAGDFGYLELCIALVRACVPPLNTNRITAETEYCIRDLQEQISIPSLDNFNVSLLQREQLPWLFFTLIHFCDKFEP